ncbi:putative MFS transporter, AGZA family, xanthine/uracil permease [Streptomyces zhaozhouensis]|uniref:Putative MFS transporter, AGZA family, xanthine/uracil permease n=1 Tax=Streptomyces zhaozhouensis TaxID=1300267 RepID=A0A286DHU5_9ACTN|nr:NCS2 family permease [Streptomyces zhaozhouensis]SOD58317.1 putative MFS transporter, AGZA family, xanthine/uracil permease [Streptomyces zhaozhouensis]
MPVHRPTQGDSAPGASAASSPLERFFQLGARGSNVAREVRGGVATFFTMAYILVLNPLILSGAQDVHGDTLSPVQVLTVTALVAGVMTILMGITANLPLALAAGLGINAMVAFQIAPRMSWPDAMGLVVLEGLLLCVISLTGFREAVMNAIPMALKQAIGVGIGLFIALIGFVNAGFTMGHEGSPPLSLGATGELAGWPVLVFCLGLLLTLALLARRVKGAILISIVVMTVFAMIVNAVADIPEAAWGLTVPVWPDALVAAPDFGLVGQFSLFGAFAEISAITVVLIIFTLFLTDFFDTMGTAVGVTSEAGLLDDEGRVPRLGRLLFVDGLAAAAGGAASASSNTSYVESAAGVGEGARTGLANLVTGALFGLALFLSPLATVVPAQAAAPALVAVGFLMMTQVARIDWADHTLAIPAFVTIAVMPFTFSITNGIGAGFVAYVVLKAVTGRVRDVNWLVWVTAALFVVYFAIDPIRQALGVD